VYTHKLDPLARRIIIIIESYSEQAVDVSGHEETETFHIFTQHIRDRHRYDAYSTMLPEMKASDMS